MTDRTMPRPLNADPEPPPNESDPGPKASGTLGKAAQPPGADPGTEEKPDSGTTTKGQGMLGKKAEPGERG